MWATCFNASNNIHFNYPPIMADGRNYATWQPESVINDNIRRKENITTSWQYRKYLTNNALQIMKLNTQESCVDLGLNPYININKTSTPNVPHLYSSVTDNNNPKFGYSNNNLKTPYLSREQLQARMISPSISIYK